MFQIFHKMDRVKVNSLSCDVFLGDGSLPLPPESSPVGFDHEWNSESKGAGAAGASPVVSQTSPGPEMEGPGPGPVGPPHTPHPGRQSSPCHSESKWASPRLSPTPPDSEGPCQGQAVGSEFGVDGTAAEPMLLNTAGVVAGISKAGVDFSSWPEINADSNHSHRHLTVNLGSTSELCRNKKYSIKNPKVLKHFKSFLQISETHCIHKVCNLRTCAELLSFEEFQKINLSLHE